MLLLWLANALAAPADPGVWVQEDEVRALSGPQKRALKAASKTRALLRVSADEAEKAKLAQQLLTQLEASVGPSHPATLWPLLVVGEHLLATERAPEAVPVMRRAANLASRQPSLKRLECRTASRLISTWEAADQLGDAVPAQRRYIERCSAAAAPRVQGEDYLRLGYLLARSGRHDQAREAFETAVRTFSEDGRPDAAAAPALLWLGAYWKQAGELRMARSNYDAALTALEYTWGKNDSRTAPALKALAELFEGLGDEPAAIPYRERLKALQ